MTPEQEINFLKERVSKLERQLSEFVKPDSYTFERPIKGGTKGLGLTQSAGKIGFFGKTPAVIYPISFNGTASGSYGGTEQNIINALQAALLSYGLIKP